MRKIVVMLFAVIIAASGCSGLVQNEGNFSDTGQYEQVIETIEDTTVNTVIYSQTEDNETFEAVSETTAEEETIDMEQETVISKPKYIFYIVGDGMGYAHLLLGDVYEKILYEDWDYETIWNSFSQQSLVTACGESAGGGTALASGYITTAGYVGITEEGEDLYTIMDRANENGYATGVISNAAIVDATPATFASHAYSRYKYTTISMDMAESGIDYLAGGGMMYLMDEDTAEEWDTVDTASRPVLFEGTADIMNAFYDNGYTTFWGLSGIMAFNETLGEYNVNNGDKILALYEASTMLFQSYKYKRQRAETCEYEPDLDEMTQSAIDFLEEDDDGFVLMIEQALIDKAGHYNDLSYIAQEMHMMHKTLETVFEFYYEHPDETLIVMSADHECGYFTYSDEAYETILSLPEIDWHEQDYTVLSDFLVEEYNVYVSMSKLRTFIETGEMDLWGDDDEDYGLLHAIITEAVCEYYGIYARTDKHSDLSVPCYSHGAYAELFAEADNISEIPQIICEIMEWEALPETVK